MRLQILFKTDLVRRKSVIIFDEVQKCPNARQAIKYLVEDGRYDYIETGSLLSIKQNVKDILIPSEEHELCLFPLDYEEFKWALDDNVSIPLLKNCMTAESLWAMTATEALCAISACICLWEGCRRQSNPT